MSFVTKRRWRTPAGEQREAWRAVWRELSAKTGKTVEHSKFFPTRKAAKDYLQTIAATESPASASDHPLGRRYKDIALGWIAAVKVEKRERSTYEKYEHHLERHIAPCVVAVANRTSRPFGEYRARELTTPLIYALKTAL